MSRFVVYWRGILIKSLAEKRGRGGEGYVPIIGVLGTVMLRLHDMIVVQATQDTRDGGFAQFTTLRSRYTDCILNGTKVA